MQFPSCRCTGEVLQALLFLVIFRMIPYISSSSVRCLTSLNHPGHRMYNVCIYSTPSKVLLSCSCGTLCATNGTLKNSQERQFCTFASRTVASSLLFYQQLLLFSFTAETLFRVIQLSTLFVSSYQPSLHGHHPNNPLFSQRTMECD